MRISRPARAARLLTASLAAVGLLATACTTTTSSSSSDSTKATAAKDDPEKAELTYWYWAESDAPGANDWMKARIADYSKAHPKVSIKLVPQATDTLIGSFTTAAQSKSGPDIATQWATLPVLSQAWAGNVRAISDLVPESKRSTWRGVEENTWDGKVWAMPIYSIGLPFVINKLLYAQAGLEPKVPATWSQLISDCKALKAKGITPIGMGNKDGYFGAWFFSTIGKQNLDSIKELQRAVLGKADFSDPKFSGFYKPMAQLRSSGCLNDDISSLTLDQGMQIFARGKSAMAWGTDGLTSSWAKDLGESNLAVGAPPKWGTGKLADSYDATQSSSAFVTSWSKHPRAAAQFLAFLHEPENLTSWYEATGIFPADSGFKDSAITSPLARDRWNLINGAPSVWPENYLPPSVDGNGNLPAGQKITSGGTPAQAVATWKQALEQWRSQNAAERKNYAEWSGE